MIAEIMKEQFLSDAINHFHHDMEESERKIDDHKADIRRRIAAGEQTEGYFLRKFHEMGYWGENLDEVFLEMRRKARARLVLSKRKAWTTRLHTTKLLTHHQQIIVYAHPIA